MTNFSNPKFEFRHLQSDTHSPISLKWLYFILLIILMGGASFIYFFYFASYPDVTTKKLLKKQEVITKMDEEQEPIKGMIKKEIELFFASKGSVIRFGLERREILMQDNIISQVEAVLKEMIVGPQSSFLCPIIPKGTKVEQIFLDTNNGIVYLDFNQALKDLRYSGIYGEQLAIYALVNTLCRNFNQIKKVKFLIKGQEITTLGGHLYLGDAIEPDRYMEIE